MVEAQLFVHSGTQPSWALWAFGAYNTIFWPFLVLFWLR